MQTPPNQADGVWGLPRALRQGNVLRRLAQPQQRDVLDLFTKSARDMLDAWFESDEIKAAFGFDAIVGTYASPDTPGSAYVLLHHTFGGVNGKKGNWGHAIGGMGAITQAMARACSGAGVEISSMRRCGRCWSAMAGRRVFCLGGWKPDRCADRGSNLNPRCCFSGSSSRRRWMPIFVVASRPTSADRAPSG
ncbi:MAG: hypothetical protein WDN04_11685 [Rhodospirillales bacterium]